MNTAKNLLQEFGTQFPTAQAVSERYFGYEAKTVRRKIWEGKFPIPVIKMTDSAKSPHLIDVNELAKYLEKRKRSV
jgi:hypothetical protein